MERLKILLVKIFIFGQFFMKNCWAMENNFGGAKLLSLGDEIIILKDCFFALAEAV